MAVIIACETDTDIHIKIDDGTANKLLVSNIFMDSMQINGMSNVVENSISF